MTDLVLSNKPKYGTGQFRQKTTSLSGTKTPLSFDKYANQIKPIVGNDTKGIFKRFANLISFDSTYPTKLTESQRHGVTHKVRELIGGDNTIKNEADIEAYNIKPLFLNKSYTHGDVSNVSEIGITAVSAVAGGIGLIKGIHNIHKVIPITPSPKNLTPIDIRRFENTALKQSPQFGKDMAKVGVNKNQIDLMFSKEVPLGFKNQEQFVKFQKNMTAALKKDGLDDSKVGLKGTATTFYSENPNKVLGHHWDAKKPTELGDFDLNLSSKIMTNHMNKLKIKPNEQYGVFTNRHMRSQFPELEKFSKDWKKTLGRDVNFVGYPSKSIKYDSTEYILGAQK